MAISLDDGDGDLVAPDLPHDCLWALWEMLQNPKKFDATLWKDLYQKTWGEEQYLTSSRPMRDLHPELSAAAAAGLLRLLKGADIPQPELSLWPPFAPKVVE